MKSEYVLILATGGFHRVHFTEWGEPDNSRVLVCVHGLTRNARDFDYLAQALQHDYRVICPDMPGRGHSDWLPNKNEYSYPTYLNAITALLARLDVPHIDWLGTSMGGIIGMLLAAQPNSPIRRMVINDVGPYIPCEALKRIASYVGTDPEFQQLEALERYLRQVHAPFGELSDAQWQHLATHSARSLPSGELALHYDPGIGIPIRQGGADEPVQLWDTWDAIRCPVQVLRGEVSDVLLAETVEEMKQRGPKIDPIQFPSVGHAPALMSAQQVGTVREWLLGDDINP